MKRDSPHTEQPFAASPARNKLHSLFYYVAKALSVLVSLAFVFAVGYFAHRLLIERPIVYERGEESSVAREVQPSAPSPVTSVSDLPARDESANFSLSASSSVPEGPAFDDGLPTPLVAAYDGVLIHCPVHPKELEGVLFHQASFETALPMTTELEQADPEQMEHDPDYHIAADQPTGDEWLSAQALHLWRDDTPTLMDTSIDVGAEAGTLVYAPVTGTVVLVTTYRLYDVCDDYEIHIQPEGRPDLDVVEIHVDKVVVSAGDRVEGGVSPLAEVRNLAAEDITDIQLAYYTKEGHGNHTHVQVNDANYPDYRETRLKDAYKVP